MANAIIWSKNGCPYCSQAIRLLEENGISVEERNISTDSWTKEQLLESAPGAKTVPQIFLYGKLVGGYNELRQYYEDHGMYKND